MKQILLPAHKTKQILNATYTESGEEEILVALEDNGAIITLFVSEMATDSSVYMDVFEVGDPEDTLDINKIAGTTTITSLDSTPAKLSVMPSGSIIIKVYHSGSISYVVRAKSVSILDNNSIETVPTNMVYNEAVVRNLETINDNLILLLNHVRIITGIKADEGEDY